MRFLVSGYHVSHVCFGRSEFVSPSQVNSYDGIASSIGRTQLSAEFRQPTTAHELCSVSRVFHFDRRSMFLLLRMQGITCGLHAHLWLTNTFIDHLDDRAHTRLPAYLASLRYSRVYIFHPNDVNLSAGTMLTAPCGS